VIVQAGSLYTYIFGQIAHGRGIEAILPEKLSGLFENYFLAWTILFAFGGCHVVIIKYKISFRFAHQLN
jgi:hypothetical protein